MFEFLLGNMCDIPNPENYNGNISRKEKPRTARVWRSNSRYNGPFLVSHGVQQDGRGNAGQVKEATEAEIRVLKLAVANHARKLRSLRQDNASLRQRAKAQLVEFTKLESSHLELMEQLSTTRRARGN